MLGIEVKDSIVEYVVSSPAHILNTNGRMPIKGIDLLTGRARKHTDPDVSGIVRSIQRQKAKD